jgi:two-component system response regulator DegU
MRAGLKFLFVDDHAAMRQVLRELLTLPSDDVREAADGAEAELVFEDQRPDWVVMDVQMRPVGGLDATGHIMARHPDARIVIVSQFDAPDLRARAAEVGARAYLMKDDLSSLQRMVHPIPA